MADIQSRGYVEVLREYQKMEQTIDQLNIVEMQKKRTKHDLAEFLYQLKEQEGFTHTEGAMGLTKALVNTKINIDNPAVRETIDRMIRNKQFELMRKPSADAGEDAFTVPNTDGTLTSGKRLTVVSERLNELILKGDYAEGSKTDRIQSEYGGVGVSDFMMSRLHYSNFSDYTFAYNDNGIDVLINAKGGGTDLKAGDYVKKYIETISHLHSKYSDHLIKGSNEKIGKLNVDKREEASLALQQLSAWNKEHILNAKDIFKLLRGDAIMKNGVELDLQWDNPINLQLGTTGIAVPLKGVDIGFHRIQKILNKQKNGLVEVNDYDLAVMHQRDYDGDHFYMYMDCPFKLIGENVAVNQRMIDYNKYKSPMSEANQYGFNKDFSAGSVTSDVGHSKFSAISHQRSKAIGINVGNRKAVSSLVRLGFRHITDGGMYNINEIKNLDPTNVKDFESWGVLQRILHSIQSVVDIYPSLSPAIDKMLFDFQIHGKMPEGVNIGDLGLKDNLLARTSNVDLFKADAIKGKEHWVDTPLGKRVVKLVIKTMKEGNAVTKDTFDEAGPRPPEPYELRAIAGRMESFILNPNQFIVRELRQQILRDSRLTDTQRKDRIIDIMEMFYGFNRDRIIEASNNVDGFIKDFLYKGKTAGVKEIFKFNDKISGTDVVVDKLKYAKESDLGFNTILTLTERNFYTDRKFADYNVDFNKAGIIANNMVDRVQFIEGLGMNPLTKDAKGNWEFQLGLGTFEFDTNVYQRNAVTRGLIHNILSTEYSDLNRSLRYLSAERFTNPEKVSDIRGRLISVEKALDVLDAQYYQGLVANIGAKKGVFHYKPIRIGPEERAAGIYSKYSEPKNRTYVYRVHKDFFDVETGTVDYKSVKELGWYGPKEYGRKGFRREPNYHYLLTDKPGIRKSVTNVDSEYGDALNLLTMSRGNASSIFREYPLRIQYEEAILELKSNLSDNYRDQAQSRKTMGRSYSNLIFQNARAKEQQIIREFIEGTKANDHRDAWLTRVMRSGDLTEYEALDFLFHNIIEPQALTGRYHTVKSQGTSHDLPIYQPNMRLIRSMLRHFVEVSESPTRRWHEHTGGIYKEFIKNWENIYDRTGVDLANYLDGYGNMYSRDYNINKVPEGMGYLHSLLGVGFSSPWVEMQVGNSHQYSREALLNTRTKGDAYVIKRKRNNTYKCKGK